MTVRSATTRTPAPPDTPTISHMLLSSARTVAVVGKSVVGLLADEKELQD